MQFSLIDLWAYLQQRYTIQDIEGGDKEHICVKCASGTKWGVVD